MADGDSVRFAFAFWIRNKVRSAPARTGTYGTERLSDVTAPGEWRHCDVDEASGRPISRPHASFDSHSRTPSHNYKNDQHGMLSHFYSSRCTHKSSTSTNIIKNIFRHILKCQSGHYYTGTKAPVIILQNNDCSFCLFDECHLTTATPTNYHYLSNEFILTLLLYYD